jgi:multidrug efflux pump subunit AcrA (membrane-fusion protein)
MLLSELRTLAERDLAPEPFLAEWLSTVCTAVGSSAGCCWTTAGPPTWSVAARYGDLADPDDDLVGGPGGGPIAQLAVLAERRHPFLSVSEDEPGADGAAEIWCPWFVAGTLRGAVAIRISAANDASQQGMLKFAIDAVESIERFWIMHDRREAAERASLLEQEIRLGIAARKSLDLRSTAAAVANDGRHLIGCDRLTVFARRGRSFRVAAVSGKSELSRRAGAVRALRRLADRCAPLEDRVEFPAPGVELDARFTAALESYVDAYHVKRFVFVPLFTPQSVGEPSTATRRDWVGALLVEYFGEIHSPNREAEKIASVARSAATSLDNVRQYQAVFLLPVWRAVGSVWNAAFGPGKILRTALIVAGLAAVAAGLSYTTTDYTTFCRGRMQPVDRRNVFAPSDGVVRALLVKHGDHVRIGQPLIELRSLPLEIAVTDLQGKLTAAGEQALAVERALFDDATRQNPAKQAELEGEKDKLRVEIASMNRQLGLYAARQSEMTILSPIDGEITTWSADVLLQGRPVRQGQQLLSIAAVDGLWELELNVPDARSGRVIDAMEQSPEPLRVTYSPAVDSGRVREARIVEFQNSAEAKGEEGNVILLRASVDKDDLPQRRPGAEVAAHVHCGRRSVAYVWSRDVLDFVRSKIVFRWF